MVVATAVPTTAGSPGGVSSRASLTVLHFSNLRFALLASQAEIIVFIDSASSFPPYCVCEVRAAELRLQHCI